MVIAQRGQSGGWRMNRDPKDVSRRRRHPRRRRPARLRVRRPPRGGPYNEKAEVLQLVWIAARSSLREVFEHVSLADLAAGSLPDAVTSRTADEDAWQPH